jgi:hypothetical protein
MVNNLSNKQKFYLIIAAFILLALASYKKTFKRTYESWKSLNIIEKKISSGKDIQSNLFNIRDELKQLDDFIGGGSINPEDVQNNLLGFLTEGKREVNLTLIEDTHLNDNDKFLVYTNRIILEGNYESLITTLYSIEKEFTDSKIVSAEIYSKKNRQKKVEKIYLKIILQNYDKK